RILLATDAGGEGLNLHHRCRVVINLELPWNPIRLEQRIGRVDRIGQRRPVHVFHLIARDTDEGRILERLRARIARAQDDIGGGDPLTMSERNTAAFVIDGGPTYSVEVNTGNQPREAATERVTVDLREAAAHEVVRLAWSRRL